MKAEAAPRLMRGEVEPPVGPPQAHSLGDEKAFPAAEQVLCLGSDMFNLGPYENRGPHWPGLLSSVGGNQHHAGPVSHSQTKCCVQN